MQLYEKLFSKRSGRTSLREAAENFKRMGQAADFLGNPQKNFQSVHIAGTNGKGSVALKIAKTLECSGYKVGLFTSPHIERLSERIQINGEEIDLQEIEQKIEFLMEKFPDLYFFDYITLLAFQLFSENTVDVAVIETGIGGRFDSTNLITPLVSVITSIALDHEEILGPTLEDIAYQKAGIIKPNTPVVIGPKAQFKMIEEEAAAMGSPQAKVLSQSQDYDGENQAIAKATLQYFKVDSLQLQVRPACRFERQGRFILDVAHNPAGIERLLQTWEFYYPKTPKTVILALSADKDLRTCLKLIASSAHHLLLVQADPTRGASTNALKEILIQENVSHFTCCSSLSEAIHKALADEHNILVCGSFYIMQEARKQIFRLQVSAH